MKDNPGVRQVDIVRALKLLDTNVSRDIRKLLQDEYIIIDDKKRYHATPWQVWSVDNFTPMNLSTDQLYYPPITGIL